MHDKDGKMQVADQRKVVEDDTLATTPPLMPKSQPESRDGKWALRGYGGAVASVIAVLLLRLMLLPLIGAELPLMAFSLSVMWTAWNFGLGPALFATAVCTLVGWYVMLPPHFSFTLTNPQDHMRLGFFIASGIVVSLMGERQRLARFRIEADDAEKAVLLAEQGRLLAQVAADAQRRRTVIREMLYSVTEGRLHLCDSESELPDVPQHGIEGKQIDTVALTTPKAIRALRKCADQACTDAGFSLAKCQDLQTAVSEAAMNAVTHGKGTGEGHVYSDAELGLVQVWISDHGPGIGEKTMHRAVLERGFSSAGTLGHGFWLILNSCDRIYLLTNSATENSETSGTTVVIEQHSTSPDPAWMSPPTVVE